MSEVPETFLVLEQQMRAAHRRMRRVLHERAVALDPSVGRVGYGILDRVIVDGPARQADLGCALDADKAAVSRAVQQLIELGLAERRPDERDGRVQWVVATELGRRRMAEVADQRRVAFAAKLSAWSDRDLEQFAALLTRYNEDLDRGD